MDKKPADTASPLPASPGEKAKYLEQGWGQRTLAVAWALSLIRGHPPGDEEGCPLTLS